MKKSLTLIIVALAVTLTGCSSEAETGESADNAKSTSAESVSQEIVQNEDSNETEPIETAPAEEDSYFDFYSAKLYYPSNFEKDRIETFFWYGNLNTDDTIYYKAYANAVYESDTEYTYKDVPEITWSRLFDAVDVEFTCYESKWVDTVENESEVDIKGYTFLRRTGTIHTELDEETHEVSYVAYYGLMDFKTYGEGNTLNAPTYWIAFSEVTDEATKDDLAAIADKTAADFDWV